MNTQDTFQQLVIQTLWSIPKVFPNTKGLVKKFYFILVLSKYAQKIKV